MAWIYSVKDFSNSSGVWNGKYFYQCKNCSRGPQGSPTPPVYYYWEGNHTNGSWKADTEGRTYDNLGAESYWWSTNHALEAIRLDYKNATLYGSKWASYDGTGSKYTLRYEGRIYASPHDYDYGHRYVTVPANGSNCIDIASGFGYNYTWAGSTSNVYHSLIRISGYWIGNTYHDLTGGTYYLDEPGDYKPSQYNLNTY